MHRRMFNNISLIIIVREHLAISEFESEKIFTMHDYDSEYSKVTLFVSNGH